MGGFQCPNCQTGWIVDGRCHWCGWRIYVSRLPAGPPSASRPGDPTASCWVVLPIAAGLANFFLSIGTFAFDSEYLGMLTLGVMASELAILGIIGALGQGRHILRLTATCGMAALLLFLFISGIFATMGGPTSSDELREMGSLFLLLPCIVLSVQAPLWLVRAVLRYRLRGPRARENTGSPAKTQFGIGQLMWSTALVAVTLGLARTGLVWQNPPGGDISGGWNRVAVVCGAVAVASLTVALPCMLAVLLARRLGDGIVAVLLYGSLVTTVVSLVLQATSSRGLGAEEVARLVIFCMSTFGGVLCGLGVLRGCGYRLVRG